MISFLVLIWNVPEFRTVTWPGLWWTKDTEWLACYASGVSFDWASIPVQISTVCVLANADTIDGATAAVLAAMPWAEHHSRSTSRCDPGWHPTDDGCPEELALAAGWISGGAVP